MTRKIKAPKARLVKDLFMPQVSMKTILGANCVARQRNIALTAVDFSIS